MRVIKQILRFVTLSILAAPMKRKKKDLPSRLLDSHMVGMVGDDDDWKSTMGMVFYLGLNFMSWNS